jgi:general secretion pathway protein G
MRSFRTMNAPPRPPEPVKRETLRGWDSSPGVISRGFTLLELMMVLSLLLIFAAFAVPGYQAALRRGREAVLRDDLYTMRKVIDEFTLDKQRAPSSPDELVEEHYLRGGIPADPMTQSDQTWVWVYEDVSISPQQSVPGIVDVHSGSDVISSDGETAYSSW